MGLPQRKPLYSPEQYLRRERDAGERHHYYRGEIFAMSGGTPRHSRVTANVIRRLSERLDGTPCGVYDPNLRVRIPRTTLYTYPDASVICGDLEFDPVDAQQQTVLNPTLVVEVLSPSTETFDRGAKLESYQQIASLRQYVLVSQDQPRVETYLRQPDGSWLYAATSGLGAAVPLACLRIELRLSEIYAGVTFPPAAAAGGEAPSA